MKRFFADHSYDMVRMLLNQIAMAILGLSMALATSYAKNEPLRIATSVFSIVFYLFLIYIAAWDVGYKDKASVDVGKKKYVPYKGLLISLCANVVNLIPAILIALASIPGFTAMEPAGGVAQSITAVLQAMYSGILAIKVGGVALNNYWFVYFLTPLPAMLVSGLSYWFGVHDTKFTSFFNRQPYPESDAEPKKKGDRNRD